MMAAMTMLGANALSRELQSAAGTRKEDGDNN